jgi:hypothetical protein
MTTAGMADGPYLFIGFIPDDLDVEQDGVHMPLRSVATIPCSIPRGPSTITGRRTVSTRASTSPSSRSLREPAAAS